ncbi:MAG: GGDEF domain-containing protein, partial [Solirubrobacteraceae bacterium]|nr:GGDEF domain-containing protein [Solirubrobacteraceae bacterium]
MARPPTWEAPAAPDGAVPHYPGEDLPFPDGRLNGLFLRFSQAFGVFRAMSMAEREELNAEVLRRVITVGYTLGALTMGGTALFAADQIEPVWGAWVMCGAFGVLAIAAGLGKRLPRPVIRVMAFDITVILLCLVVAIGNAPAYLALLYFGWPALTSAHFGHRSDFIRTLGLLVFLVPVALAFSDLPLPAVAYGAVLAVSGFSALVVRAIVYQAMQLFHELDHIASTDALTGLLNRRAATVALEEAVARAHRQETELAIVIFDLDHFKRINDSLGHPAGDAALQRFAEVLRETCSGTDVAARLGGEEFLAILLRSGESGGRAFAQRFSDALDFKTARDEAPLSVSAGVAALDDERLDADSLLVAADRALYAA